MFFDRIYIRHIVCWLVVVLITIFSFYLRGHLISSSLVRFIYKQDIKEIKGYNPLLFFKRVDINHTTLDQLVEIPGVGTKEAIRILDFVHRQGFLFSISELEFPEGPLSVKEFQRIKVYICVR